MKTASIFEAKTNLSRYIAEILSKQEPYVVIVKNGKPVAFAFVFCESKKISNRYIAMMNLFFNNLAFYFSNTEKYDRLGTYLHEYVMESLLNNKNSIEEVYKKQFSEKLHKPNSAIYHK